MINIQQVKAHHERRLNRLTERMNKIELRHQGKEQNFTYHGGFDLGYLKGQINEIENMLDLLDQLQAKIIST